VQNLALTRLCQAKTIHSLSKEVEIGALVLSPSIRNFTSISNVPQNMGTAVYGVGVS